jgi:DNA-binding transcriptional ArsR family regulator
MVLQVGGGDNYYSDMHHVAIDDYVLDVLMPDLAGHEHSPSAFLVYLALWTVLFRAEQRTVSISLGRLSTQTGLSKSAIQASLRILKRRGLVRAIQTSTTAVPEYELVRHWVRRRVTHGKVSV